MLVKDHPCPSHILHLHLIFKYSVYRYPIVAGKQLTASSEDLHSASKATVFKKKQTKKTTKENISELLSGYKLILKPPLKIDEVIEHLTGNKNNIEVVNLSTDFDHMLLYDKGTKDSSRVQ